MVNTMLRKYLIRKYYRLIFACLISFFLFTPYAAVQFKQQKRLAHDGAAEDFFSFSLAISDNIALIGSFKSDDDVLGADVGSAYVFTLIDSVWQQQAKLVASDGKANDTLGGNVALFANTAVLSAIGNDKNGEKSGAVYVFNRSGSLGLNKQNTLPLMVPRVIHSVRALLFQRT
jgi:hypothetical protein